MAATPLATTARCSFNGATAQLMFSVFLRCGAPHRTAPRRTAPHRAAPHRTAGSGAAVGELYAELVQQLAAEQANLVGYLYVVNMFVILSY